MFEAHGNDIIQLELIKNSLPSLKGNRKGEGVYSGITSVVINCTPNRNNKNYPSASTECTRRYLHFRFDRNYNNLPKAVMERSIVLGQVSHEFLS